MACDITIAAESAVFGERELRFGSVITALMMPWLVGPKRTNELLLTGQDRISAASAEKIGLSNRTVATLVIWKRRLRWPDRLRAWTLMLLP